MFPEPRLEPVEHGLALAGRCEDILRGDLRAIERQDELPLVRRRLLALERDTLGAGVDDDELGDLPKRVKVVKGK